MLDAATPNAAQAELLTEGMINLIGMLGNVCNGLGEAKHIGRWQATDEIDSMAIAWI